MMTFEPTMDLRFVRRDGRSILQQRWEERWQGRQGELIKELGEPILSEWRDVPLFTGNTGE